MKIRIIIFFFISLFFTGYTYSQEFNDSVYESKNFNISIETGLIFNNYGKGLNQFSNYYYPKIHYNLSQTFKFNLGIVQLNQLYSDFFDENSSDSHFHPKLTYIVGRGNFILNKKLSVYGKIIKQIDDYGINYSINPAMQNYSFGINYSILPNLNIGLEFRQSENNYRYYYPIY